MEENKTSVETEVNEDIKGAPQKKKMGFKTGCYLFFKRLFDIVFATILLIVLSWLILICIFVKWLEDFHNPIYVSKRVGRDGKVFNLIKIRTMCPHADELKEQLIAAGLNEADPPAFKMENDPRVTKVGKFLRRFSFDGLLKLLNVIAGHMSFVGPRPPEPQEVECYDEYQMRRLSVKGGLLCLWQIQKGRNKTSFDEWIKLDLQYIEKRSLWLDTKIIFKGFYMVIFDHSGK